MLGRLEWDNHYNVFDEHIYYVRNDTQKPFKMNIFYYPECVRKRFEMAKLLPPLRWKNEEYHKYAWETRDMNFKEEITHMAIRDRITTEVQKEVEKRIPTITPFIPNSVLTRLGTLMPGITGGVQLVNPRSMPPRRIRLISLMGLILIVSRSLGFFARNASLTM